MSKLSQYFTGIAAKRLSAVETDPETSNQHEFNGIKPMTILFGTEKVRVDCDYLYFSDDEEKTVISEGFLTWYDARQNHQVRTEYRLYFQHNNVMELATAGDLLVIGRRPNGRVLVLVAKRDTTIERQVLWLFGVDDTNDGFTMNTIDGESNREIGYAERTILETLGIEIETEDVVHWIDKLLENFGNSFPPTRVFSEFARQTLPGISIVDEPDMTIMACINREELLFRILERHIVQERIDKQFTNVDDFVAFSLSVQNRRKARVGFALENHLETIFNDYKVSYSRGKTTENRSKPDFIFPGIVEYHNLGFPVEKLTMLGVKSTCKDRWRQVLAEASRIDSKHLFTLEPGISLNQTDEMRDKRLQLVVPESLHNTYLPVQQRWLMSLSQFIALVSERQ